MRASTSLPNRELVLVRMPALMVFLALLLSTKTAVAQEVPPNVPTMGPAPSYTLPPTSSNPLQSKTVAAPLGPCGDSRIKVLIVGRVPDEAKGAIGGFVRIAPGRPDDAMVAFLRKQITVEHDLVWASGDPQRISALLNKYGVSTPLPHITTLEQYQQMTRRLQDDDERVIAEVQASKMAAIDKEGRFRCNALPPGWYNFIATMMHPEIAGSKVKQFGPYTIAKRYYLARAYVSKPVKNRTVIVPVAAFQLLSTIDPNAN